MLNEDRDVATFRLRSSEIDDCSIELGKFTMRKVDNLNKTGTSLFDWPRHSIRLRNYLNDVPLVDLTVNPSAQEISFKWKETLNLLFREEAHFRILKNKLVRSLRSQISALVTVGGVRSGYFGD